jgi:hypothetical protein
MFGRISMVLGIAAACTIAVTAAAQNQVSWTQAVDYVAEHGQATQFYGPVAASFGLSAGGSVNSKMLSRPGNPKREFYVTANAVVLLAQSTSGTSRGYVASRAGVLLRALDRSRQIPLPQAGKGFEAEKAFWLAAIAAQAK